MKTSLTTVALPLLVAFLPRAAAAQPPFDELGLETLATGLASPVAVTHAGDDRLFLTLQEGRIVVWDGQRILPQPFLDLRPRVLSGGERGLLSVAFHPRFADNGFVFVNYTNLAGDTVVARFRADGGGTVDPGTGVTLLTLGQPFSNHNGGQLQFGPDGFLYIGMGDGGSANDPLCSGQRDDTLLGKMLRLDVDQNVNQPPFYGIPPGNPYAGPGDPPGEVWARGLRNPWRFSFDRSTGDLFIADVGQGDREEIDFQPAGSPGGANYGWKVMEGTRCLGSTAGCAGPVPPCNDPAYTPPILEYDHSAGDCAVVGGHVYRGSAIRDLGGVYFYGDFCTGRLWAATRQGGGWTSRLLPLSAGGLSSFGEDAAGEIYLTTLGGRLLRLTGPGAPPPPPPPPQAEPGTLRLSAAELSASEGEGQVLVSARRDGGDDGAVSVRWQMGGGSARAGEDYTAASGVLAWADGEAGEKSFAVELVDDAAPEPTETVEITLSGPTGGAALGSPASAVLTILDDDVPAGPCVPGPGVLCLVDGRFRVQTAWETPGGERGAGTAGVLSNDAGTFWFFDPANVEVLVKVIDACGPFDRFWVFAAGLTNVRVTVTVIDTGSGQVRQYENPQRTPFQPVQDTEAFATCP